MPFPLIAAALLVVLIVALHPVTHGVSREAQSAQGYTDIVNRVFVPKRWLRVDADGVVRLSGEGRRWQGASDFYKRSYLAADGKRREIWRIENGVVSELFDWAHNQRLPFQQRPTWRGSLFFRGQHELINLSSANLDIRLADRTGPADEKVRADAFQQSGAVQGSIVDLYARPPFEARNWVVRLQRLGTVTLVQPRGTAAKVSINGREITDPAAQELLRPGDQLAIAEGARRVVLVSHGLSAPAITVAQPLTDRYRLAELEAFSLAFETAMDQAVSLGIPSNTPMTSSLDYGLQTRLQRQLASYAAHSGKRFAAAATVIDAQTGEILAIASYPAAVDPVAPGEAQPRNHNFELMPIGSAAKVPITAAILAERRDLADLHIQGGPAPIDELFGLYLAKPLDEEHALEGQIGLNEFLKYSSNRYAASIMLLAGTSQPHERGVLGRQAHYSTSDGPQVGLPPLGFGSTVDSQSGRTVIDQHDEKMAWPGRLKDLYDIEYEQVGGRGPPIRYGDDLSDMTLWRDLLDDPRLARRRPPLLRGLREVSPTRMNFASNNSRSFRSHYVQMIIGGQGYGWTTIKLAEAYARLVTGNLVQARLLQPKAAPAWGKTASFLHEDARGKLLTAMALPAQPGGTAAAMQTVMPGLDDQARSRGEELRLYSKTGSPHFEESVRSRVEKAEDDLIARQVLVLEHGQVRLRTQGGTVTVTDDPGLARRLAADERGGRILRAGGVGATEALSRARRFNQTGDPGLYRIRNGVLVGVTRGGNVTGSDVKVYAFVLGRYAPGTPIGGAPKRSLAVVVNVQHQWIAGNEAVTFARCVLPSTIAPVLFDDPSVARPVARDCQSWGIQ